MDTGKVIANNQSELLTREARALFDRPENFAASEIAPNISRAGMVLGRFFTFANYEPIPDQLGELMEPNVVDIYKKPEQLDFEIEDHELIAKVGRRFVREMELEGLTAAQTDSKINGQLVTMVRAIREIGTANLVTTSSNYASGMYDTAAKGWNGSSGDPYSNIMSAIDALDAQGADTNNLYMAGGPLVWSAIRQKLASKFQGIQARVTADDVAGLFGAHAIVCRYQTPSGTNPYSDTFQIFTRPEQPNENSMCAWRTVNAGQSGSPEPTVYRYWPQGHEHRYYVIGCYHDYKVVGTGCNSSGKQRFAYLFTDTLT